MNNETIKEGDWVIYTGRPDQKFVVYKFESTNDDIFNLYIVLEDSVFMSFNNNGFKFKNDTNPIVKKTTPPKKKVLKEFFGKMSYNKDLSSFTTGPVLSSIIYQTINPRDFEAKIIIEVEE